MPVVSQELYRIGSFRLSLPFRGVLMKGNEDFSIGEWTKNNCGRVMTGPICLIVIFLGDTYLNHYWRHD